MTSRPRAAAGGRWHAGAGGRRRGAPPPRRWPGFLLGAAAVAAVCFAIVGAAGWWVARGGPAPEPPTAAEAKALARENEALRAKIARLHPRGRYVVIDTARNRLRIHDGEKVVREAVVSCGSGGVLQDPSGKKTWVFDTPRGERVVRSRVRNPAWIKPDWAFIEEGEPPPKRYDDRVEEGVLGDYALGIGDGYFLHGTLYTRLLGRNVTHGCVRIGDEDLAYLYRNSPIGTKVYLF